MLGFGCEAESLLLEGLNMPVLDTVGCPGDFLDWKSEIGARIHDFLARKSIPAGEKLGAIVHRIEGALSAGSLRGALTDLVRYFKRVNSTNGGPGGATVSETEALFERILVYRKEESIENYGAFLFTVDVQL